MNSLNYKIYRKIYQDYLFKLLNGDNDFELNIYRNHYNWQLIAKYAEIIDETIDEISNNNKIIIRPDAKFFLLLNFHQMIIKPILIRKKENTKEDVQEIESYIKEDLNKIILSAAILSEEEEDISSHKIMTSIDNLWNTLNSTKLELWG